MQFFKVNDFHGFSLRTYSLYALLLVLSLFAGINVISVGSAKAEESSPRYHAVILNESTVSAGIAGKSYVLHEDSLAPLTLNDILQRIAAGDILKDINFSDSVNLGYKEGGTWVVIPVSNTTRESKWMLDLGSFWEGRFASLKTIQVYNATNKTYALNTDDNSLKFKNLPDHLLIDIPAGQTSFFVFYLKPNLGTLSFVKPNLLKTNVINLGEIFESWGMIIFGFGAFLYFLKIAYDTTSIPQFMIAAIWFLITLQLIANGNFTYIGSTDIEILSPFVWLLAFLLNMGGLVFLKIREDSSSSVMFGGAASLLFIIGCAGLVMLRSLPALSVYLIYVPVFLSLIICAVVSFFMVKDKQRIEALPLALLSSLCAGMVMWYAALGFEIIPQTAYTLSLPGIFLLVANMTSIFAVSSQTANGLPLYEKTSPHLFRQAKISPEESENFKAARDESSQKRLMQVIEHERRKMEELRKKTAQQNEEMRSAIENADEANRAKSAFLAVVSHEIRTPMTGIMGMLRLLQDTQLTKDQKEYASTIKDSGDAMLALLNDILDFEKIESGRMELESIPFDLKRLVKGVQTLMRGHAEAKNIDLICEIDPSVPTTVIGDPTRLRQVLLNLVNNAIKFTTRGSVCLSVRDLTGGNDEKSSDIRQIYFAVRDSGIGINAEGQKRLFMPFAQADSSISRKYGGTGLGLAICKRLIDAMGGAININSKEDEGSTFFFTLNLRIGESESIEKSAGFDAKDIADEHRTGARSFGQKDDFNLKILIVDDNGINRKVAAGFIERLGGNFVTAGTGAETLEMIATHSFDLILLDINLPDMSGIKVAETIRALPLPAKAQIPIVALTGNAETEDIKSYKAAGMDDVAVKPITFEKMRDIMQKIDSDLKAEETTPLATFLSSRDIVKDMRAKSSSEYDDDPNQIAFLETDRTFPSEDELALNEDEEDSFALAVRKFEEMEQNAQTDIKSEDGSLASYGLDEAILGSLKSGLSVAQIEEILVSFYEKADELIADIGKAYSDSDKAGLSARSHELKGMAGNFGFADVAKQCGIIEKTARAADGDLSTVRTNVDTLGETYARSRDYLKKWLSS